MSNKCIPLGKSCTEHVAEPVRKANDPFTVCVGTNALVWDGQSLTVYRGTPIPDGEYTAFTIRDGCLVSAGQAPVPEYTPPPCVESPAPCDGSGSSAVVSPRAGNLTTDTPTGLYTQVVMQQGAGITIMGTGTTGDPIVVSAVGSSGPTIMATTSEIDISNPAANVIGVGLKPSGLAPGTYAGITFNSHGIATGYAAPNATSVTAVVGAAEVEADNQGGAVTVSLKSSAAGNETYNVGGYSVSLSQGGVIETMTQNISFPAGIYTLGAYNVTYNQYGSATAVQRTVILTAGIFTTADGKTVHYDEFGTITQIT